MAVASDPEDFQMWQILCAMLPTAAQSIPHTYIAGRRILVHSYETAVQAFDQCLKVDKMDKSPEAVSLQPGKDFEELRFDNAHTGITFVYALGPIPNEVLETQLLTDVTTQAQWTTFGRDRSPLNRRGRLLSSSIAFSSSCSRWCRTHARNWLVAHGDTHRVLCVLM